VPASQRKKKREGFFRGKTATIGNISKMAGGTNLREVGRTFCFESDAGSGRRGKKGHLRKKGQIS